jgi:collagenase-like PrtC family protease
MKLNVAANFDMDFIDKLSKFKEVSVVFGRLSSDFIGGGIESSKLQDISLDYLKKYIEHANSKNIQFNYVMNAPILNNEEFTDTGKEKINNLLEVLQTLNLEALTVANLFLIHYIKKNFPKIPMKSSANMMIDSVDKAKYFQNLGVDIIVLDPLLVNRNFKMLKAIRKAISGEIEVILNNNCIIRCPYLYYHQSYLGLNSRDGRTTIKDDFCFTNCSSLRAEDPTYWLRGDWIRPEDLHYYEELGYDRFKIVDRSTPADVLVKRVEAYANRKYDGNLMDLIEHYGYKDLISPQEYIDNIYIDNTKLDGFIEPFLKGDCSTLDCGNNCTKCVDLCKKAITVNESFRNRILELKRNQMEKQLETCHS